MIRKNVRIIETLSDHRKATLTSNYMLARFDKLSLFTNQKLVIESYMLFHALAKARKERATTYDYSSIRWRLD